MIETKWKSDGLGADHIAKLSLLPDPELRYWEHNHGQSWSIMVNNGQSWSIMVNHGQSRSITVNHGRSRLIAVNHVQSRSITVNHGQSYCG